MSQMDDNLEIPGYKMVKRLGEGAMAAVYLAIQESLERQVALKVMAGSLLADPTFCERFLKEGKIVAQLNHPHIVTIYDIGVFQSYYYMAMEYIPGDTLKQCIQDGLPVERATAVLCQIASALGYAHKRGFIHRDVKPANILLRDDGTAVLSDFGIAKALGGGATQMTAIGFTVGTPNYMSPEQALGRTLDARADLYSLGIVFHEVLTGRRPYESDDSFATALMHVNNPLPRLPEHLASWQGVLDRLLAKDPAERFANADELIRAVRSTPLAQAARSAPTTPTPPAEDLEATRIFQPRPPVQKQPPPSPAPQPAAPARRGSHLRPWLLGLALTLPLAGGAVYWLMQEQNGVLTPAPEPAPSQESERRQPLSAQTQAQVDMLLNVAAAHREVGRLTDPPGSNAAEAYHYILEMDPDNPQAQAGLQEVADEYLSMAKASLTAGDQETARRRITIGLEIVLDHMGLLSFKEQLQ